MKCVDCNGENKEVEADFIYRGESVCLKHLLMWKEFEKETE